MIQIHIIGNGRGMIDQKYHMHFMERYFVSTHEQVSAKTIKQYMEEQKTI